MQTNPAESQTGDRFSVQDSFNVMAFAAQTLAACVWPFLRSGVGVEALRGHGAVAFALMLLICAAGSQAMLVYLALWSIFAARQRWKADPNQHSRYTGFPAVAIKIPGFRSEKQAKAGECLLCLFVGVLLMPIERGLARSWRGGLLWCEGVGEEGTMRGLAHSWSRGASLWPLWKE